MSDTTRTRKTSKTRTTGATGTARTPHPVPDRNPDAAAVTARTDAEDALWAALHADPDSTATDLSKAAKIGKSTAQKILTRWAGDGTVIRTAGIPDGGRRSADRWAITPDAPATPADTEQNRVVATVDDTATEGTPQPTPDTTDTPPAGGADPEPTDSAPIATAPADTEPDTAAADNAAETVAPTDVEPIAETAEPTVDGASSDATAARLAPGALRGMVEDHLRDHPDQEFSPVDIARKLGGKSSGAVSNALDKLVKDKIAVQTKERPKRFALAPKEATAAASA
ncbi:hypothetical protein SAMN05192558_104112 [Actinokineospora alba]|uniref:Uncharacterized protein n=1 Tax=Actinokineospora alba TaxID=504798 RepID=A0A1H0LDX1_9PSEU|nr:MarR family transcriptional regulator [Actinokineospora alba]TDP67293.1 hypothetical protein C8E96_2831 [Actinokineospora alba]SDJ01505.1 hypothetical protein SAMN05421871_109185 [Actinokineospora alba]SDO66419.1 hypothetical protein SAMN05192558_104112 [Actinokineospora alba]